MLLLLLLLLLDEEEEDEDCGNVVAADATIHDETKFRSNKPPT